MKKSLPLFIFAILANIFCFHANNEKQLIISGGSLTPTASVYPLVVSFPANEYRAINLVTSEISTNDYKSVTLKLSEAVTTTYSVTVNDMLETAEGTYFSTGTEMTVDLQAYGANKTTTISNIILLSCAPATEQTIYISEAYLTKTNGEMEQLNCTNANATTFGYLAATFEVPLEGYPTLFRYTDLNVADYNTIEIEFAENLPMQLNMEFKHLVEGNETLYKEYVLAKGSKLFSFDIPSDYETIPFLQLIHLDYIGDMTDPASVTISSIKLTGESRPEEPVSFRLPLFGATVDIDNVAYENYKIAYSSAFQPIGFCDAKNSLAITDDYTGYVIVFNETASGYFEIKCNDDTQFIYGVNNPSGTVSGSFGATSTENGNFTLKSTEVTKFWMQRMWNTDGSADPTVANPKYAEIKEAYFVKSDGSKVPMVFYGQEENTEDVFVTYATWASYEGIATLNFGDMMFQLSNLDISAYKEVSITFGEATTSALTLEGWPTSSDEDIISHIIPTGTTEFRMPLEYGVGVLYHFDLINMEEVLTTVDILSVDLWDKATVGIESPQVSKTTGPTFPTNVYSIQGILVHPNVESFEELNSLPKGIYIVKGGKFLVK